MSISSSFPFTCRRARCPVHSSSVVSSNVSSYFKFISSGIKSCESEAIVVWSIYLEVRWKFDQNNSFWFIYTAAVFAHSLLPCCSAKIRHSSADKQLKIEHYVKDSVRMRRCVAVNGSC